MGLFTRGPEHNEEWAGLPSEPARQLSDAERLAEAAPSIDAMAEIGGAGAIESILIPVAPVVEVAQPAVTDADPGEDPPPVAGSDDD